MNETSSTAPAKDVAAEATTYTAKSYGAQSPASELGPLSIKRRAPRPEDVQIKILILRCLPLGSSSGAR